MISDNSFTSYGQAETTSKDNSIKAVIEFLDIHLPTFPADLIKRISKPSEIDENSVSQELEIFLRRKRSDELFDFKGQWNANGRIPDFGVWEVIDSNPFGLTQAFFQIEAKILPTGSRDYVAGNYGGIERFKRNLHGRDLPQSAMVGYIQKGNCSHWHSKINEWINDLIKTNKAIDITWNKKDLLKHSSDLGKVQKLISENKREKDLIVLHHYLMDLN